ncbi:MAG: hypothetical protein ABIB11_04130 [Candidatus Omnitrophota bacterium]
MENKYRKISSPPLVFTVKMAASIVPYDSGDYVAMVVKKKYNTIIVPYTVEAITRAAVRNQKEKRLTEVTLTFSPKSSPAKLTFVWVSREQLGNKPQLTQKERML